MIGRSLGQYQVTAHLGSGGMGDVYEASDSRLGRQVAIKLLPEAFAADTERRTRFEREARVLASLNHPNIAALHGFEEADGAAFLVMELVPGETLGQLIARGPLPLKEALRIASQIADALSAAHQRGIVHRDLKPANVKITPDGTVKVLDFGLAKPSDVEGAHVNVSHSPTISVAGTQAGVILGTAAYMSPEQARGRQVDKRSDIWSFGCVLYEMLVGRQVFSGETVTDSLAKILEREPALDRLPPATPAPIRNLIRRALQKDPRQRLHDIADARIEIDEAMAAPSSVPVPPSRPSQGRYAVLIAAGVAAGLLLGAAAAMRFMERPADREARLVRFPVLVPPGEVAVEVEVSPDGASLAIVTIGPRAGVWVRALDGADLRFVPGSEDAASVFWSPDGRSLAVIGRDNKLRRIDRTGGPGVVLAQEVDSASSGGWSAAGVILYSGDKTIRGVAASSGAAVTVTLEDGADSQSIRYWPRFLPDGQHFLYFLRSSARREIRVGSLAAAQTVLVTTADSPAEYSSSGHLLFQRGALLLAQPFDAGALTLGGEAMPVASDSAVGSLTLDSNFSVAGAKTFAYLRTRSGLDGRLKWFDRTGRELDAIVPPAGADYLNPTLSPDERRIAVNNMDPHTGNWDIWVIDVESKIATRVTADLAQDSDAVWSPDGGDIVFVSNRGGSYGLYRKRLRDNSAEELLLKTPVEPRPTAWTTGGQLIYEMASDIFTLPIGGDNTPKPVVASSFREYGASVSPDGNWIAYSSQESGSNQVYVQPFPGGGEKTRVSREFGIHPRWRRDGRELVFWSPPKALMSVDLRFEGGRVRAGEPRLTLPPHVTILDVLDSRHHHAMTGDGQRFLLRQPSGPPGPPVNVILNWTSLLTNATRP